MTEEYSALKYKPFPDCDCHYCGTPLIDDTDLLMARGVVQSGWRKFFGMKYCALICRYCKSIGGWEKP